MSTEKREAVKAEPGKATDADVDVSGLPYPQAQMLADAARDGTPFCEKCKTVQHAQAAPQDG